MRIDAQIVNQSVDWTKKLQTTNGIKAEIAEKTEEECQNEGDNLIFGERRSEHPDRHVGSAEKQQAEIRSPGGTGIDVFGWIAQSLQGEIIHHRWQQRQGN